MWPLTKRSVLTALFVLFPATALAEVRLDQGVSYLEARGPRELTVDDELRFTFRFRAEGPLEDRYQLFAHVERRGQEPCRSVRDERIVQDGATSERWVEGPVEATVSWDDLRRCGAGTYDVFVGLFSPRVGDRLAVLGGAGSFERIHAARVVVRGAGERADDATVSHEPILAPLPAPPFELPAAVLAVILVVAAAFVVAVVAWKRRWKLPSIDRNDEARGAVARAVPTLVPIGVLIAGVVSCLGFVKDDAYISFRYAHNLVTGQGMVFNAGERVEGYTNFLWTLAMAPFDLLGADLIQVCDVIGPLLSVALVVLVVRATRELDGPGPAWSHLWGALWLASSSSFVLWSVGGLEQSLAALLPFAGALLTWQGWQRSSVRREVFGGLLLAAGCLTRPEGHLFVLMIGCVWLAALATRRQEERPPWRLFVGWAAPLVVVLAPYHLWRYLYFGSLLPNTYLVKAVSGPEVYRSGFHLLADMLRFNWTGAVIAVAAFSLLAPTRRLWRWLTVSLALFFMAYVVKIGTDELMWHRLFLPALPFVVVGAGAAMRLGATAVARKLEANRRWVPYAIGWVVVAFAAYHNLDFTYAETRGLGGYGGCSGANHPDLGKFLTRHSRPGELVAFQDMGATPFHAPDLRFLDLVGLVDRSVAGLLQRYGVHPFVGATRERRGGEFCIAFRDYVFSRRPEWVVLVPWPSRPQVHAVAERFYREDPEDLLRRYGAYANTQFDCHLYDDPRFRARYGHVRTWMRSPVYYLSTFRRRDLLDATPREVVLDEPPASLTGPSATFENGVELLGGHAERAVVVERHEVFVTTWWRVPGPRSDDLQVFVHLTGRPPLRARTSLDHPPGDWMYPASRWRPGQVIEDRVLVQLPVGLDAGRYDVHVGLFNRRTGERVAITSESATDDQSDERIDLGHIDVRPMRHFRDPLIPRTDPEEQRGSHHGL